MGARCALLERFFFQSKANSMPSRYIWPLIVIFWSSEAHGSVTKPLIRRRKFSSHQDVFLPLASRVSCIHLSVFSGEMYKVKNVQHQTLLASAIYCAAKVKVLPATFVHELCTLALAAQWSPWGTARGQGASPTQPAAKSHRQQSFPQIKVD